jgi:Ca2+-dependent lipid-binding protein
MVSNSQQLGEDTLSQKVNLRISCEGLKNLDTFSKSDPCCKVSQMVSGNDHKIGKTETIQNNLSPNFTKTVTMDYFFEQEQVLKFVVADDDDGSKDIIGQVICTLG